MFVCTLNQMRSKTAEELYKDDERFIVKSAGMADEAPVHVDSKLLEWADYVVVMEEMHEKSIKKDYPRIYAKKKILSLDIPDMYFFMQRDLIDLMQEKFESVYEKEIAPNA